MWNFIRYGLLIALITAGLTGCFLRPYKIHIQQGNIISEQALQSIRLGMSRDEVVALFGKPVLTDLFGPNRLIYVYTFKPGYGHMFGDTVRIFFAGDRVVHYSVSPIE